MAMAMGEGMYVRVHCWVCCRYLRALAKEVTYSYRVNFQLIKAAPEEKRKMSKNITRHAPMHG